MARRATLSLLVWWALLPAGAELAQSGRGGPDAQRMVARSLDRAPPYAAPGAFPDSR